jgi:ribosomal protein L16 Arg81 hydroxylase
MRLFLLLDLKLAGARIVTLNPGDVLFVPNGWWHYVETLSSVAISINTWVPLVKALSKIF